MRIGIYMTKEEALKVDKYCKHHKDPIWGEPISRSEAVRKALTLLYEKEG